MLEGVQPIEVLAVPRSAVLSDQQGDYVLAVGAGDKAEQRRIKLGQSTPTIASVISGLAAGDKVIVEGLQRVRPGQAVSPGPASALIQSSMKAGTGDAPSQPDHGGSTDPRPGGQKAMMSAVFIDRPATCDGRWPSSSPIAGALALTRIPVAQLPDIVPPQVRSPGLSGRVSGGAGGHGGAADRSEVVGVDKMIYMKSTSSSDGSYNLTVSFGSIPTRTSIPSTSTIACKPRCAIAPRGAGPGPDRAEAVVLNASGRGSLQRRRQTGSAVHHQLRHHQRARRAIAHAWCGAGALFGRLDYSMRIWFDTSG